MKPREAIAEIRKLFGDGFSPGADDYAIKTVRECCACLRGYSTKREKIGEIEEWANQYFSARKWQSLQRAKTLAVSAEIACGVVESSLPKED
jgi:hypothetical protein